MTRTVITTEKLAKFRIKKRIDTDPDLAYCSGFENKCAEKNVDPLRVIEIANTLELKL